MELAPNLAVFQIEPKTPVRDGKSGYFASLPDFVKKSTISP
jgi:hypothetical protein